MDAQTALDKLQIHLLGKDWYIVDPVINEQGNDLVVDAILRRYPAVDESPVNKWRRRHKRCAWCQHCTTKIGPGYIQTYCHAKEKGVDIDIPRPFCSCFELKVEKG